MKILIGYPPLKSKKGIPTLSGNRQFQWFNNPTLIFPIVLASAATLLKERGFNVLWKDAIAEKIKEQDFIFYLNQERPDLFVFETKTPVIKKHWEIINNLKKLFPQMKIALVGDHVTFLPRESLENSQVDYVITGGDYDFSILELCQGKLPKGLWYKNKGKIKNNGKFTLTHNLDSLPFIDRDLTKWKLYQKEYNLKGRPYMYIMSARDCPWHKCKFCIWAHTLYPTFRVRSVKNVLDEIGILIDKYKVKEIFDDSGTFPLNNKKWADDFCNGMIKRGYNKKIRYSCNMRVDYLTKENAELMKKAGFRLLKIGLESANQATLDKIDKGIKVQQIVDACKIAKEADLTIHLTMILGYYFETREQALNTFNLAKSLMQSGLADVLQSTVLVPYPGTPLWKEAKKNHKFRYNPNEYERYDMTEPMLNTPDMSSEEVMALCNKVYKIFLTPKYMIKRIIEIKSFRDITYILKGAKAVLGHLKDFSR